MREHNAVCDKLHAAYPQLSDDELYDKARLVVAALMAKIHTVDWTPAIIAHPTTVFALRTNWWGLEGERLDKRFGRRTKSEVLRGIPGSPTNHHGVPYSLTEEFVAVYRMHPLIPDEFSFRSLANDSLLQEHTLPDLGALHVRDRLGEVSMDDLLYSFGTSHPGAITLHNYPRFLQHFDRPDGTLVDLASIDVLRTRERGVPRYNEFRRLLHLKPFETFEQMADTPEHAEELRAMYGDVERVDTMIGMYAEKKPKGFGFSDTAFRIFILMASRRLESDRFFTRDYRPDVYTQEGIDWVESTSMQTLLLRHHPELKSTLQGVENPFAPWTRASA
jgi:Animal haem peroxidase